MANVAASSDQWIRLHGVPWKTYEAITETIGDRSSPRTTYLEGELEITSPGMRHEHWASLLARLIEMWAVERGIPLNAFGSWTHRKKRRAAGLEPDECYSVGQPGEVADLAIEVIDTHGTIDKLAVYRRLGVGEVWFWEDEKLQVFALGKAGYSRRKASRVLPAFPLGEAERILRETDFEDQTSAVIEFRRSISERGDE